MLFSYRFCILCRCLPWSSGGTPARTRFHRKTPALADRSNTLVRPQRLQRHVAAGPSRRPLKEMASAASLRLRWRPLMPNCSPMRSLPQRGCARISFCTRADTPSCASDASIPSASARKCWCRLPCPPVPAHGSVPRQHPCNTAFTVWSKRTGQSPSSRLVGRRIGARRVRQQHGT